jgi:hypothetical protein
MAKLSTPLQGKARALVIRATAALFFLQALVFVFSADGRIAFARGAGSPAIALAGEICQSVDHEGPKAPGRGHERRHCALCPALCGDQAADFAFSPTRGGIFVEPFRAAALFSSARREVEASTPAGWSRFCSSRAPPRA